MTSVWFGSLLRGRSSSLTFRSRFSTIVCAVLIFHLYEIAFSRARAGRDLFWNGVMSRLRHLYTGELEGQGEHGKVHFIQSSGTAWSFLVFFFSLYT